MEVGVELSIPRVFGGRKIREVQFGWLDLVVILGVFKRIWRFLVMPRPFRSANEVQRDLFYGCFNHDVVALG